MSAMTPETQGRWSPPANDQWRGRPPADRSDMLGITPGLATAGLAAIGLGVLAWYYLGPDLVRYLKIRNM
jgi:hypothetical protein